MGGDRRSTGVGTNVHCWFYGLSVTKRKIKLSVSFFAFMFYMPCIYKQLNALQGALMKSPTSTKQPRYASYRDRI